MTNKETKRLIISSKTFEQADNVLSNTWYKTENKGGTVLMNVLLVIDLQKQFRDTEGQYEKCLRYIKDHQDDYYVIGILFRNFPNSMYVKHLGWSGCMDADESNLEFHYGQSPRT